MSRTALAGTVALGLILSLSPFAADLRTGVSPVFAAAQAITPDPDPVTVTDPATADPEAVPPESGEEEFQEPEMPDLEPGDLPEEDDIAPIDFGADQGEDYTESAADRSYDPAALALLDGIGSDCAGCRTEVSPTGEPKVTWTGEVTMILGEDGVRFVDHETGGRSHTVGLDADGARDYFTALAGSDAATVRAKAGFGG